MRNHLNPKPVHFASLMRGDGAVSALCFQKPRAIDLNRAIWTNEARRVTCKKCRAILAKEK